MLQAFGYYGAIVGLLIVIEFFHVGFKISKIYTEQQETNRLLRQLVGAGSEKAK
jgi:hypothetical protein